MKHLSMAALVAVTLFPSGFAAAEPAVTIYQATELVTGSDTRQRHIGISRCLRDVLVKASGEPNLASDPRILPLLDQAEPLVAYYLYRDQMEGIHHHDDQGTYDRPFDLTVQFDPAKIDAALKALGEKTWTVKRPTLVPAIAIHGFDPPYRIDRPLSNDFAADGPIMTDLRASLGFIAAKYGVRLRIPAQADLAGWGLGTGAAPGDPAIAAKPALPASEVVVSGTLDFRQETLGWVGAWSLSYNMHTYHWGVKGVSFDRAFDNLVTGAVRVLSGHGTPD